MIYVDTSVVLATLLSEDRVAPPPFWQKPLVASRLLSIEVWVRIHARRLAGTHADQVGALLGRVAMIEMEPGILARALDPFPVSVRTLDAIHLATLLYLRAQGQAMQLATFDERMAEVARRLRVEVLAV